MDMRLLMLVGLALFAVVGTTTLVPLAEATCTPGGIYPECVLGRTCDPLVLPDCDTPPP